MFPRGCVMSEKLESTWSQTFNYAQHSGLTPDEVERAIRQFQQPGAFFSLFLTQKELFLLRNIIECAVASVHGRHATAIHIEHLSVSLAEISDLKDICKKLWPYRGIA